ncbi:hypothetical protein Tco_1509657 [Tanacetum coccineum]
MCKRGNQQQASYSQTGRQPPHAFKQSKPAPHHRQRNLSKHKLPQNMRKGKADFQNLIDEDDEINKKLFHYSSRKRFRSNSANCNEVVGKGKAVVTEAPVAHSLGPSSQNPKMIHQEKRSIESSSTSDSERTESDTESELLIKVTKSRGVTQGLVPLLGRHDTVAEVHGSKTDQHHDLYPKVHERPEAHNREPCPHDKPESPSGYVLPLKNLDDTVNFGDQFLS